MLPLEPHSRSIKTTANRNEEPFSKFVNKTEIFTGNAEKIDRESKQSNQDLPVKTPSGECSSIQSLIF